MIATRALIHAAAAAALACLVASTQAAPPSKTMAVTIDDLPFQPEGFSIADSTRQTQDLLAALRRHGVRATGFVNEDKLQVPGETDARTALLDRWLDAGMELGNHSFAHVGFQGATLAQYEEALLRGEVVTRRLLDARGMRPRYYRYPYNQTGATIEERDAFVSFLKDHGYEPAPVTIEDDDSIFALVYADDVRRGDEVERDAVRSSYLRNLDKALDTFEGMSEQLFRRKISQVFLIHANRLNADTLDLTLASLERRGYSFVSLEDALADPAYASPDGYAGPFGPSWLRRWADGLGRRIEPRGQPDPEDWVQRRYDEVSRREP